MLLSDGFASYRGYHSFAQIQAEIKLLQKVSIDSHLESLKQISKSIEENNIGSERYSDPGIPFPPYSAELDTSDSSTSYVMFLDEGGAGDPKRQEAIIDAKASLRELEHEVNLINNSNEQAARYIAAANQELNQRKRDFAFNQDSYKKIQNRITTLRMGAEGHTTSSELINFQDNGTFGATASRSIENELNNMLMDASDRRFYSRTARTIEDAVDIFERSLERANGERTNLQDQLEGLETAWTDFKQGIVDLNSDIASLRSKEVKETVAWLVSEQSNVEKALGTRDENLNQFIIDEMLVWAVYWMIATITILFCLLWRFPLSFANLIIEKRVLIEVLSMGFLLLTIIILGSGKVIQGEGLSGLLGTIAGYIFARKSFEQATQNNQSDSRETLILQMVEAESTLAKLKVDLDKKSAASEANPTDQKAKQKLQTATDKYNKQLAVVQSLKNSFQRTVVTPDNPSVPAPAPASGDTAQGKD